ncbi:MAG: Ig-like domain-containing protein, partial [Bdellovibrionota bacterium]
PVPTPAPTATPTPAPQPVTVAIQFPTNGQVFARKFWTTLTAHASGASQVTWYADNAVVCTDTTSPYTCSFKTPNRSMNVVLKATARSANGTSASQSVTISVR